MDEKIVSRRLRMSCKKSEKRLEYTILCDGHPMHKFMAKDEETAQIYFNGFVNGAKAQRDEILRLKKISNELNR